MNNNLKLVYVNPIGINSNGLYEYDLFFSETPDVVWGENWEIACPSICGDLKPDSTTYNEVKRVSGDIEFYCVQQNSCFSMQDCVDGCIALMWFYDENNNTVVFKFGEDYDNVIKTLSNNKIY